MFDLAARVWCSYEGDFSDWPEIPFWPIENTWSLDWGRAVISDALLRALTCAGLLRLPKRSAIKWAARGTDDRDADEGSNGWQVISGRKELGASGLALLFFQRFVGDSTGRSGKVPSASMEAGARALRARWFDHILDRDVLCACLAIDYRRLTSRYFLLMARQRENVLRVLREHRNLLPLLARINPAEWNRDNLFSRRLWVRDGRRRTLVDYKRFVACTHPAHRQQRLSSFAKPSEWRYLSRAPSKVVNAWLREGASVWQISALVAANVAERVPVIATVSLIRALTDVMTLVQARDRADRLVVGEGEPTEVLVRLVRIFLRHAALTWRLAGYKAVRTWLQTQASMLGWFDYLLAVGFDEGQPSREASWASLARRSEEWHERVYWEEWERSHDEPERTWTLALPATTIGDITFTPLLSSRALAIEGRDQRHCVGSYDGVCAAGAYAVYRVTGANHRSTLGISVAKHANRWKVHLHQHCGTCNTPVEGAAKTAADRFVQAYRSALKTRL